MTEPEKKVVRVQEPYVPAKRGYMPEAKSSDWETPQFLYDELHREFQFNLDPCADASNAKCKRYFTEEQNGLVQSWEGARVFLNPPYGKNLGKWVEKAATSGAELAVCLLPSRTDVRWFHNWVYRKAEVRFLKGRLKFGGGVNPAPFPSMIVVFRKSEAGQRELYR